MQIPLWTAGLFLVAEMGFSKLIREEHQILNSDSLQQQSSSPSSRGNAQRGLNIDLNFPPPDDYVHQNREVNSRGDLGGSISRDLSGWNHKQERTRMEVMPELPKGSNSDSKDINVDDYRLNQGDSKRMRRMDSIIQRGGQSSIQSSHINSVQSGAQRRVMPRQGTGKAAVTKENPYTYYGFSSPSNEGSSASSSWKSTSSLTSHSGGKKRMKPSEQDTATSSRGDTSPFHPGITTATSTKSATLDRKNYVPGSRNHRRYIGKKAFYKEWDKVHFNTKIEPVQMAQIAMQMKIPEEITEDTFGRYTADEIKKQGGKEYHDLYIVNLRNLKTSINRINTKMSENGELDGLSPEERKDAVFKLAISREIQGPRKVTGKKRPGREAQQMRKLDTIEAMARKHLIEKKIDFDKAPLNKVEKELRDLDHTKHGMNLGKAAFVNGLHHILIEKKGASEDDIGRFVQYRKATKDYAYNSLRTKWKKG